MFKLNKFKQIVLACSNFANNFRYFADSNSVGPPIHTALYDFHIKHHGKMVNFGGYMLPVQYADQGISLSHLHTRRHASIFDVSHMLQTYVRGKDAIAAIESICTADINGLPDGAGTLTVFTNDTGGILDDLIVSKVNAQLLYIVSNAAMKSQDMQLMKTAVQKFSAAGKDVHIEFLATTDQSLIAVQGPEAVATVSQLLPRSQTLDKLYFMQTMVSEVAGVPDCRITRCGYTGEDGVEISIPSAQVQNVTVELLAANKSMKMAGLGARDSLRLEAGLCLYGSDISAQTTPVEAGLAWLVARRRRTEANFPGADRVLAQLKAGNVEVKKRRVGFIMRQQKQIPPARAGVRVLHEAKVVGEITSGCPSPSLGKNIAMGYIDEELKQADRLVHLKIRDSLYEANITRMPFVKSNYYMSAKK